MKRVLLIKQYERNSKQLNFILNQNKCHNFYSYYWGHGKLGRCVIQLSKFLNHTLATHNQGLVNLTVF
jgi:hypothetical protein